jgi:hypothetical protein
MSERQDHSTIRVESTIGMERLRAQEHVAPVCDAAYE